MLSGRTLTLRRAIVMTVVLGLLIPVLLISGYSWFKQYTDDIKRQTWEVLQQNADILSNGMQEALWNINQESGNALMEAMMARNPDIVRIEVRDNALGVFVASERPERREGYTAVTDKPVMYRGNTIGSVKIEVGSTQLRQVMVKGILGSITAVLAQAILSIVLILILLDRRLVRPLQRLGIGAERLANRELDAPFTWQRLDEIGLLSRRLEDTRTSLRRLFAELDEKNRELEEDIDKRKRVEQELHEREERYRALVEQSPIAIIEWDAQFKVIEWNAAAERIFGYPREQAIGRSASFIMYEAGPDSLARLFRPLAEGRGDSRSIGLNLRADGQIITCQWSHTHIADDAGKAGRLLSIAEDITEKRRAEQALTLSEAKFAGAFRGNPDSISISRVSDGVLVDINDSFIDLTGYRREEIVGNTAYDLGLWVHPEQRRLLLEEIGSDRLVRNFEWELRTKEGALRRCVINATAFTAGNERCMLAVIRDVTDQRLLEERKAEADRALMRLAQGTHDMTGETFFELLVADLASALRTDCALIALCSPNESGNLRTIAAHVYGHTVEDFDYRSTGTPCAHSLAGELHVVPAGIRTIYPDAGGPLQDRWESYAGAPLRDAAGKPIGVMAIMHSERLGNPDLVKSLLQVFSERASAELERKRTEEKLLNSERRLSTIFKWSPVAMFVTEIHGRYAIKDVNYAFEQLFKRRRESILGRDSDEAGLYCEANDRASIMAELEQSGVAQSQREIWMNCGDGGRALVQFSAHTFSLNGESFAIAACVDMTYKHDIENEIRELNANLEQRVIERTDELQRANLELATTLQTLNIAQEELVRSEKLAALGSIVAGVAHELNTPIGNSLMVASTLADQARAFGAAYEANGLKRSTLEAFIRDTDHAGDILVRNLHRAANLVTSFKQVAVDQTSSQRREFQVAEAVSEIMLTLWPTLRKTSFTVRQDIPEALRMDSYPGPLGQVITNLVNNALLHGFDGRQSGTVEISAEAAGEGWIEIAVADDGVGIPAANLNRIFDPFFTTKLGAGGSGLGLNITHNIVTGILGGRIRVHSDPGMGTTFVIALPMIAPQRQGEEESLPLQSPA
jgi:PAS domain S-box-containing protein